MNRTNRFSFLPRSATLTVVAILTAGLAACVQSTPPPAAPAGPQIPRLGDRPDFNGVWQAIGTAYWNLEDHSATGLSEFWQLGAIAAIPAGQSVVEGGTIPYLPAALAKRDENRAGWPKTDPEAKCYMPGIPRARVREREPHRAHVESRGAARRQLDGLVERPLGGRHARDRGHRQQRPDLVRPRR
jgi:hypothetical protein